MRWKVLGFIFLVISLLMIFWGGEFNITGNVVDGYFGGTSFIWRFVGIGLFVASIFLLNTKKDGLEYLVIPTGWEEDRIPRAKRELDNGHVDKVVVTGYVPPGKTKESHRQRIYKSMREYGLKPSQMRILKGIDSEEDVLYLGKFLDKGDTLNFDTFPLHYQEYKALINKAKRDGKFPKGIKLKNTKTRQGLKETLYGVAGLGEEVIKRRKLDYVKDRKENKFYNGLKEIVKKILR